MVLEVLKFPDPRLRKKGLAVKQVTAELKTLADNMLETMYAEKGIGLAAPQVGESVRLLVIDTRPRDDDGKPTTEGMTDLEKAVAQPLVIFNPEVKAVSNEKTTYEEGCLSVPGFFESVERFCLVEITGLDREGAAHKFTVDGLLAVCVQHEIDHLEGKLFIDRLSFVKSNKIKNRIQKHGYPTAEEAAEVRTEARERKKARRPTTARSAAE